MGKAKPVRRRLLLDFLGSISFSCEKCGSAVRPVLRCRECRAAVKPDAVHFHHIIPPSMGGSLEARNVMLLCDSCHRNVDRIRLKLVKLQDRRLSHFSPELHR